MLERGLNEKGDALEMLLLEKVWEPFVINER